MRRLPLLLVVLLAACSSTGRHEAPLRVMIYNIHAGRDASAVDNLERVAALITANEADLVFLQEVDRKTRRSGGVDQLEVLTRLTKLHGAFGKSLDYQGGEYGIAMLSRWPIVVQQVVPLPVDPPQTRAGGAIEPRIALAIETMTPTGVLRVMNTHLDASREETYRLQEINQLLAAIRPSSLVGGDFNAEPGSRTHERLHASGLRDAWLECGEGTGLTFPASQPVKRIDYLFFVGGARCTSARVLDSRASDHRALLVIVRPDS